MTTYPAEFGRDVMLTCYTFLPLKNSKDCPVRQWSGGTNGRGLMYNGVSVNDEKYEEKVNLLSSQFSLIIKNFSITDINVNYTCSCGFYASTHTLNLDGKHFQYLPDAANASITSYNDTLKIKMQIRKVYPLPNCSVYIGNRVVSKQVQLTHRKSGLFYSVNFVKEYKLVDEDCNKKPRIQCALKTYQIKFEGHNTSSCPAYSSETSVNENTSPTEESFNKKSSSHNDIAVVVVACVCALLVVFVVLCVLARKHIQSSVLRMFQSTHKTENPHLNDNGIQGQGVHLENEQDEQSLISENSDS
ncbi:uncharacterized protein LOC143076567 [Mytilus galloprovincialis]|uniref:uncharacterized protein LOC143076567 n=1 Tax=Mytilus galloprovincialis TaxID=29158 RepID=UPI003F7BF3D0